MSQHDLNIANQGFPAFRSDLNNALVALGSLSSGASAPSSPTTHQLWLDSSAAPLVLKFYDGADWITLMSIDASANSASMVGMTVTATSSKLALSNAALTLGVSTVTLTAADTTIAPDTSDGSDTSSLTLCGGGATGSTRGGTIKISGNEDADTGKVDLIAGNVTGGQIRFQTGAGVSRAVIDESGRLLLGSASSPATGYTNAGDVTLPAAGVISAKNTAKAWVNFNGSGTVAIRASHNVTSITDNGAGDYTVNFTNAMTSTNYCYVVTTNFRSSDGTRVTCIPGDYSIAAGSLRFGIAGMTNSSVGIGNTDNTDINVCVFQ